MNKHRLIDYMNYRELSNGGLIPDPEMLGEIANTDWWTATSEMFNQIIWQKYFDRTVLMNEKFPFDIHDPDNTDNMDKTTEDILYTFTFHLQMNAMKYAKMWEAVTAEFHPLYNVDAWETEDRTLNQGGTDTHALSGNDTLVKTGNQEVEKLGSEAVTRSGNETDVRKGSDVTTTAKTTFDDATFYDTEQVTEAPSADNEEKHTYNSVKDEQTFTGRKDKTTYNSLQDQTTYGRTDTNTKNLEDTEHIERRRYGNIGVTKSTDLAESAYLWADKYLDFYSKVVHDCVNTCTYMVE